MLIILNKFFCQKKDLFIKNQKNNAKITSMIHAPQLPDEEKRSEIINSCGILDNRSDLRFDALTKLATEKLEVPISTVTLISGDKEIYKSCIGLNAEEAPRAISFCGHAIAERNLMVIEDTLEDERFVDNPYVIGEPFIRFYCGIKLVNEKSGIPIGVFCVKDTKPRKFSDKEVGTFLEIAKQVEDLINTF